MLVYVSILFLIMRFEKIFTNTFFCRDDWLKGALWLSHIFNCSELLLPHLNMKQLDINDDDSKGATFD